MPAAAEQAHAQAADQVHQVATQASAALNKLAQTLQKAGVPDDVVKQIDDMANSTNEIASAAVGNAPEPAAPAAPDNPPPPPRSPMEGAIQDFHGEQVAAGP